MALRSVLFRIVGLTRAPARALVLLYRNIVFCVPLTGSAPLCWCGRGANSRRDQTVSDAQADRPRPCGAVPLSADALGTPAVVAQCRGCHGCGDAFRREGPALEGAAFCATARGRGPTSRQSRV